MPTNAILRRSDAGCHARAVCGRAIGRIGPICLIPVHPERGDMRSSLGYSGSRRCCSRPALPMPLLYTGCRCIFTPKVVTYDPAWGRAGRIVVVRDPRCLCRCCTLAVVGIFTPKVVTYDPAWGRAGRVVVVRDPRRPRKKASPHRQCRFFCCSPPMPLAFCATGMLWLSGRRLRSRRSCCRCILSRVAASPRPRVSRPMNAARCSMPAARCFSATFLLVAHIILTSLSPHHLHPLLAVRCPMPTTRCPYFPAKSMISAHLLLGGAEKNSNAATSGANGRAGLLRLAKEKRKEEGAGK